MRAHFLGVRGSTSAPGESFVRYGGYTSCVAVAHDGDTAPSLILDAGTGIRRASLLCDRAPFAGTILLSHLHWDHVHGLPFFSAADHEGSRADLFLPEQLDGASAFDVLARAMSPPHFPIGPDGLRGNWSFSTLAPGTSEKDGFIVEAVDIPHKGGRTYGYRISDGSSVLAYLPDHCPRLLGPGPEGLGEYHPAAVGLARDADVLVHDSQMTADEMDAAVFLGHSAAEYAVGLGRRAGAKLVALFHHSPDRSDDDLDELPKRFGPETEVVVAGESLVLEL